jgi:lysophospholipase L1-like esterase
MNVNSWRISARLLILLLVIPAVAQTATNPPFALRDGDRVIFYGDSITAQRFYTRLVEDIVVSRYPHIRVSFYNAGVSGDTVQGGHAGNMETRVKRDVLPWHPTVVTMMLGMNDGRYTTEYGSNAKAYEDGYRELIAHLKATLPGVRLFLIRPSPYDEVGHSSAITGYNSVMLRYGEIVSALGREENVPVIDFNQPMTAAVTRGMKIDKAIAGSLLPDRIHPSLAGHWIMAAALAQAWSLDPIVSSVNIDVLHGKSDGEHNTFVRQLRVNGGTISWTQLDEALPLPFELNDPITQFVLQVSSLGSLDQQLLTVTGLAGGSYTLSIDGRKVSSFTAEQLSQGVNLALYQTAMEDQAKSIDWTADDRSRVSGARFGLVTEKDLDRPTVEAVETLDGLDHRLIDEEYANAQPKPHNFELVPGDKER